MIDYRLPLMAGIDIVPIPELLLTAHIPVIKDIAFMGESMYFLAVQYLCLKKELLVQDKNLLKSLTNFQVLMEVLELTLDKSKKIAINTLLNIIFPDYLSMMTPNSIILASQTESGLTVLIDKDNFDIFLEALKQILCFSSLFQTNEITYNPVNARAKAIADKIMQGRRRIAMLKHGDNSESVLTRYISVLVVAGIITLKESLNCNLFLIFDLMERYNKKLEWDIDLKVRLAGGKPDKQVETWMKDLHSKI